MLVDEGARDIEILREKGQVVSSIIIQVVRMSGCFDLRDKLAQIDIVSAHT